MPAFITNVSNRATTQAVNFEFNSLCSCFDKPLAASEDGLYELCADDDNGVNIDAVFRTGIIDFGEQSDKTCRYLYVGIESDGDLIVSVSVDGEEFKPYDIIIKKQGRQRKRISLSSKRHGRYFQFEFKNTDGSFFAIDNVSALVNVRSEGVGGR